VDRRGLWRERGVRGDDRLIGVDDIASLLQLELETLWITDDDGRVVRARTPEYRPAPALTVAQGHGELVWAAGRTVDAPAFDEIADVFGHEHSETQAAIGWRPTSCDRLLDLLGAHVSGREERGPAFVLTDTPEPASGIDCWTSEHIDSDNLRGRMREEDRCSLVSPWAVAVIDGSVAAVCETARSALTSVEAGVWTYEPFRRRGFGAAAVAAWTNLVTERTVFYSTTFDNVASQRIAHSLGFRPIGHWWWIHARDTDRIA
jgi:hypothetical protein